MALDASLTRVYCRGVDLSTNLQSTTLEQGREEPDATAYASALRDLRPTIGKVALAHAGLYEDGAHTIAEAFRQARAADDEPITICPEGLVLGKKAFIVLAHKAGITLPEASQPGGLHKVSLRASSRSVLAEGVVALPGAADPIIGDSATVPLFLGPVAAGLRILATVHILSVTGTPSVTFNLQSDDNQAFTSGTGYAGSAPQTGRGSLLLELPGPNTDTWWSVNWDNPAPHSLTAVIAIGIAK